MAYDMVVMRANPDLANSMRRLEDAFLTCKEEMEKNWQEMLKETKGAEQKQEWMASKLPVEIQALEELILTNHLVQRLF